MPLIADDYGLGRLHDAVMRELLSAGAIDGVSVLTGGAELGGEMELLRAALQPGQTVGLHLNLTLAMGEAGAEPLQDLLLRSLSGRLDRARIKSAIRAQWSAFAEAWGGPPDFVDGHQHVHAFPGIAEDLAQFLVEARFEGEVRHVGTPAPFRRLFAARHAGAGFKSGLLSMLGAAQRRVLRAHGLRHNADFGGIAPLASVGALKRGYPRLVAEAGRGVLVMVHPGSAEDPMQLPGHDPACRAFEAEALMALSSTGRATLLR